MDLGPGYKFSGFTRLGSAGTAIETNVNGKFKITLHKNASLEPKLQGLDFPLLENANEYVVHGFTLKVCSPLAHTDIIIIDFGKTRPFSCRLYITSA